MDAKTENEPQDEQELPLHVLVMGQIGWGKAGVGAKTITPAPIGHGDREAR